MFDEKKLVSEILGRNKNITDVFFAACGGSLNDLFPVHYFIESESKKLHSMCKPARELVLIDSPRWNENSITFVLSHSGNTPEAIEAAKVAKKNGSFVIAITNDKNSKIDDSSLYDDLIVYDWGTSVSHKDVPMGIEFRIVNEFLHQTEEDYAKYDDMLDGFDQIDSIIENAKNIQKDSAAKFAQKYRKQPFLYILGSGASTSQAYGFAICSLMEMQWMDCAYINSAEFFHGPFEVLQDDKVFIQCINAGKTRVLDERSRDFIKKYHGQLEVIDVNKFGMDKIKDTVVDYFNPFVFYEMGVLYRDELSEKRGHQTDFRQYMGKVDYSYKSDVE